MLLAKPSVFSGSVPQNLAAHEAQFFMRDVTFDLPEIRTKTLSAVHFNEAGELFDANGVLPESFLSASHLARDIERFARRHKTALADPVGIGGQHLWITDRMSHNYYHWLCDCLPRLEAWLMQHADARLLLPRRVYDQPYVRDSLAAYPQVSLIEPPPKAASGRTCLKLPGRVANAAQHHPLLAGRVAARLKRHFAGGVAAKGRRLHVSRSHSRFRRLANEAQLLAVLEKQGVEVVHLEQFSFGAQVRLLGEAEFVSGPHGAGLTNMMFMPRHSQVLELRQLAGTPNCFFTLANVCGHRYQVLGCASEREGVHPHAGDLLAEPQRLEAALRQMR